MFGKMDDPLKWSIMENVQYITYNITFGKMNDHRCSRNEARA